MSLYPIEKDVPVPGRGEYPFGEMGVGDSFMVRTPQDTTGNAKEERDRISAKVRRAVASASARISGRDSFESAKLTTGEFNEP